MPELAYLEHKKLNVYPYRLTLCFQRFSEIAARHVDNKFQLTTITDCLETMLKKLNMPKMVSVVIDPSCHMNNDHSLEW